MRVLQLRVTMTVIYIEVLTCSWAGRCLLSSDKVSNRPGAGNVATAGAKGFGKRAHHDIHIQWIDVPVLTHTAAMLAHCPYAVCFIQEQVCLKQMTLLFSMPKRQSARTNRIHRAVQTQCSRCCPVSQ